MPDMTDYLSEPIARRVWEEKYRYRADGVMHDATIEDTWRRVAHALGRSGKRRSISSIGSGSFTPCCRISNFSPADVSRPGREPGITSPCSTAS